MKYDKIKKIKFYNNKKIGDKNDTRNRTIYGIEHFEFDSTMFLSNY